MSKKYYNTNAIFLVFITIVLVIFFSCFTNIYAQPNDSIITNNNIINNTKTLNELNEEILQDGLNYTFKKEEINSSLSVFKIEYINTINEHISNGKFQLAYDYLNNYFNLFSNDTQVLALKEFLQSNLTKNNLVEYVGDIEVLSFNPLISYPTQALSKQNSSSTKLDENHITIDEFSKILLSLYEKNYILISTKYIVSNTADNIGMQRLMLPKGKKPLILILEDVEYDSKVNGCVDKLLIDRNDQLSTYTPKRAINDRIHQDNDFITILEGFIKTHPSFSYNGAKALIVVDGSKGIFGYKTQKSNATSKYEIKKAIEITNYLKNNGYDFASEGYNTNIKDSSVSFASGLNTWQNEVTPITGNTNIFFLNTNILNLSDDSYSNIELLNTYCYNFFIGLEAQNKFELSSQLNGIYLTAKQVNGKTLRYSKDLFSHLFDCERIYDHLNRTITFNS